MLTIILIKFSASIIALFKKDKKQKRTNIAWERSRKYRYL